ncbi:MAG TPA: hypothetical protein HPP77_03375 [Candidatus Hydrogenedentes bacterium]|nr:hypothetical protein [Candidatus Hydrogenedentota bacterium]HIJ72774.1 hypothetical protein [Candidatus Hydrogenedentota bacterium]
MDEGRFAPDLVDDFEGLFDLLFRVAADEADGAFCVGGAQIGEGKTR